MAKNWMNLSSTAVLFFCFLSSSFSQPPDTLIQNLINQTKLDSLVYYVNSLSGEDSIVVNNDTTIIISRNANHPHNDMAADYLFQTLSEFGLSTFDQSYSSSGRNVFAVQTGSDYPDQQFILCAHYDDIPYAPAPGADDNASGCAAVLEAARILSQIQTPYTIIFALWDEEEIGLVGSAYYAQQAFQSGDDILGVINLEMFGWDGNDDGLIDIHTRPIANSVELANLVVTLNNQYTIGLNPVVYNPGTTASDHSSFWNQGYSALVFSQAFYGGDFNPFYHTSDDRIVHFNLSYFYQLSRLAVAIISHLAFYNTVVDITTKPVFAITDYILQQNYPNPFNPATTIEFTLPQSAYTNLKIYNAVGEEIITLASEFLATGRHRYHWNAAGMPSGIYLYKITAGNFTETRKMILLR